MYVVRTECHDECPAWKITVFISSKTKELRTYLNSLKHHRECPSHVTCSMGWPVLSHVCVLPSSCRPPPTVAGLQDHWPSQCFLHNQCPKLPSSSPCHTILGHPPFLAFLHWLPSSINPSRSCEDIHAYRCL